jgi:PAS domain S-box-containing protein
MLVALQVVVAISVYQIFETLVVPAMPHPGMQVWTSLFGCFLAVLCTYFLLNKYQMMIQQFSLENDKLWTKVETRTAEFVRANEVLKQEIAERKRVEEVLSESEARFRTIIQEAAIGIAIIDLDGRLMDSNPALQSTLGYRQEELRGLPLSWVIHPKDARKIQDLFSKLADWAQVAHRVDVRFVRRDGREGWCRISFSLVLNSKKKPQFIIAMVEDITSRKEAENKICNYQKQLQTMASELSLVEERERRGLATGLHDHIGQTLAFANIKLTELIENFPYQYLVPPMQEVQALIEQSIKYSRSLIFELSPPILYDLGLEATVEWLADHMQQQHDFLVEVEDDGKPKPLDNDQRVLLFRAVRELLVNIIKHAHATVAKVNLQRVDNKIQVTVEDDGVGFDVAKISSHAGGINGFGLFSITERLNYLGGDFEIESSPGHGTKVKLEMLIKNKKNLQRKGPHSEPPVAALPALEARDTEIAWPPKLMKVSTEARQQVNSGKKN